MNETTIIALENYYVQKLKDIDDYINKIAGKNDYQEKRMFTIMKLDNIEKEIMTRDWSTDYSSKRKSFRPLIYKLYNKLNYCPPKRNKQDFERNYNEERYQKPEHNPNRADVSKCPAEVYTETSYNFNESIPITNKNESLNPMADKTYIKLRDSFIKKLESIEKQINDLLKQNAVNKNYRKQKKLIIAQLDDIEQEIMMYDWGIYNVIARKDLRVSMNKLYKKLNYCPPRRNKQDFERKEYKDPEQNPNREDLSNCEQEPEDVDQLYNFYVQKLKEINKYIDNLQKPNHNRKEYKQRNTIILELDNLEERIMKHDWDINYRTRLRPLLYYLYNKLKYCPPNRPQSHFERKHEEYKNPVQNNNRDNVSKCETEQYEDENNMYANILDIQHQINLSKKMKQRSDVNVLVYSQMENNILKNIDEVENSIRNKFWYEDLIPIINGMKILCDYVFDGKITLGGTVNYSSEKNIKNELAIIQNDINALQNNSSHIYYLKESLVNIIKKLNDVENQVNKNQWNAKFSEKISTLNEQLDDIYEHFFMSVHHEVKISIVYINKADADEIKSKISIYKLQRVSKLEIEYDLIDANKVDESLFTTTDYIIFIFPNSVKSFFSQPKIERMVGFIIRLNDTGKCIVLNKPNFNYFDTMKFKFENDIDKFLKVLFSFNDKTAEIKRRTENCRMVPWYIWINKDFQRFYKEREDTHAFRQLRKVRVYTVKQSFFVLLLDYMSALYVKIVEDDSEQLYDNRHNYKLQESVEDDSEKLYDNRLKFGRSNRRKVKKYDGTMLRRVHRLHEKLRRRKLRR